MMIPKVDYNDKKRTEYIAKQEKDSIAWGNNFSDSLIDRIKNGDEIRGSKLPWASTWDLVRLREGEVTLWAGMNGHKKSMLTAMVLMWLAREERVGIMSFEMPVVDTMERLTYQASGCKPGVAFAQQWADWNEDRICYYDQLDTVPSDRVLGVIYHMAKELGCKHIMIDSLTKCSIEAGDHGGEKRFMDALSATAKAFKIHIHIVAHVRKPDRSGEDYKPNKFDVRGAGELTDLVDNLFIIWKDKKKEDLQRKKDGGGVVSEKEQDYLDFNPDQRLICEKQRRGKWEGQIGLDFHDESLQFIPPGQKKKRSLPFDLTNAPLKAPVYDITRGADI